jgi:hypothetical protein
MIQDLHSFSARLKIHPFTLGFYLERTGAMSHGWPTVLYRGVNRFPYPRDSYGDRVLSSSQNVQDKLWDEWSEANHSGALRCDLKLVWRLRERFLQSGVDLELIYVECNSIPGNLGQLPSAKLWTEQLVNALNYHEPLDARFQESPSGLHFLGFDVSTLHASFHSALFQPGLNNLHPEVGESLNPFGLIDDLKLAEEIMDRANQMDYGPLPFCVLGVWEVPKSKQTA